MKSIILNPIMGNPNTSTVSSMKIARFLRDFLKVPLITGRDTKLGLDVEKTDILFIVNSSTIFTTQEFRDYIPAMIAKAKVTVYIQNDYLLIPRKFWREIKKPFIFWTGVKRKVVSEDDRFMDFNVLTYDKNGGVNPHMHRRKALFYYGSCRPGRIDDMKKYFDHTPYQTVISASSPVALRKFESICDAEIYCDKSDDIYTQLMQYSTSLYIADKSTIRNLEVPANRFYECISSGTAILFDEKVVPMMENAGYKVENYVVISQKDVKQAMNHSQEIADHQKRWQKDFVGGLRKQIKKELAILEEKYL